MTKKKLNQTKKSEVIKTSKIKKILVSAMSIALTIFISVLIASVFLQALSNYYEFASKKEMTLYDLSILSSFSGGVFGVLISKFSSIVRSFNRLFERLLTRKRG